MGELILPSIHPSLPIDMVTTMTDIIDLEGNITYRKYTTIVWVQEGINTLVPHVYKAWCLIFDGDVLGPIEGLIPPVDPIGAS